MHGFFLLETVVRAQSDGGGGGGGGYDSGYDYNNYGSSSSDTSGGGGGSCEGDCSRNLGIVIGSIAGAIAIFVCCRCICSHRQTPSQAQVAPELPPPGGLRIITAFVTNAHFPTGTCRATGTHTGHAQSEWNQGQHKTSIDTIVFNEGRVVGVGRDAVGAFTLQGSYVDATGSFQWIKSYSGMAVGETGDRLQGTWNLVHKQDHGTFDLTLVETS